MNKKKLIREVARRSRATIQPLTVEQATLAVDLLIALMQEHLCLPEARLEIEGLFVLERRGTTARVKISPLLKARIAEGERLGRSA